MKTDVRTEPRSHSSIGFVSTWPIYQGTTIDRHAHALLQGICAAARDRECRLVIGAGVSPVAERSRWRTVWPIPGSDIDFVPVGPWNMDGLIIVSDDLTESQARHVHDMQASGVPVVFTTPEGPGPRVVVDNKAGIRSAVRHLLDHGHRNIAFVAGTRHQRGDSAERLRTFRYAMRDAGVEPDERLIAHGDHRFAGGVAAMSEIMATNRPFTAFVASNDLSCLGAIEALRLSGRAVPDDVAAIGFDDILDARSSSPLLTTVRHPTFALGYQAVVEVLERVVDPQPTRPPVIVPTRLITRQSCGCRGRTQSAGDGASPADGGLGRLPRRMAEAAFVEARHSTVEELEVHCGGIVEALTASIERRDERPLRDQVTRLLADTEAGGEDTHAWQSAISLLHLHSEALLSRSPSVPATWLMGLLDHARLEISQHAERRTAHALLRHMDMMSELGLLTAQLIAARDIGETRDILANLLPRLGVDNFLVALYAGTEEDPVARSEVLMTAGLLSRDPGGSFPSRRFPPEELYRADPPVQLIVLPLDIDAHSSGFVALPASGLEPAAAIVSTLATAIRASRLYGEAVEGRRMAEEANRLKSRFLSMVSHELRTPLSVVVGLSDMVLRESRATGQLASAVDDLERLSMSAQHLGRLIGDVIDLASSEAGQLRLVRQPLDLIALMRELCATGEVMAREKGLAWRADLPGTDAIVSGDRTRLRQVVLNLLTNAVKYTAAGEVRLSLDVADDRAVISISDTGPGIPADEQEHVFDEFYRSESGRGQTTGSLGLGLAISRQLVHLHSGTIELRSPGPGGSGSTFRVSLPLTSAEGAGASVRPSPEVLILTDRAIDGSPLVEQLRARGIETVISRLDLAADAAAEVIATHPEAVILAGGIAAQGWDLVRRLKHHPGFDDVPVLAYGGDPESGTGAVELNLLHKPLDVDHLAQVVHSSRAAGQSWDEPTILIVDDDPDVRRLHVRVVEQAGGRALEAGDGTEALATMERAIPDLVLLDLGMPEMDGFQLLEAMRMREQTRDIPVIVITGQVLQDEDVERLNRSVATILSKGIFSIQETITRVESALARRRALGGPTQQLVRRATAYIHAHHAEPITRDDIARHVAMSPDYLTDCFHKELGITPIVYLNRCRIHAAKGLLERTDVSITEIALGVGFSDASHFTRTFHRETGVAPRAYRRGQRSEDLGHVQDRPTAVSGR